MTERLLAQARDADGLRAVNELLHDAAFSMSEIAYDDSGRVVRIAFAAPKTRDLFRRGESSGPTDFPCVLTIAKVTKVATDDPEGLVEHSYSRLATAEDGELVLTSNFPGRIELSVDGIDVRITQDA
jgi:hypothetical protein